LELEYNLKIFLVEIKRAAGKKIAEHLIRPVKLMPASHVKPRCAQPQIITHRLWMVLKRVEERRDWRMVCKRMILVLM